MYTRFCSFCCSGSDSTHVYVHIYMWSYVHIWAGAGEFWGCVYLGSPNSVFNGGVHDVLNIIFLMALTPQGHIEEHICMDVCGYWSILICCSAVFFSLGVAPGPGHRGVCICA